MIIIMIGMKIGFIVNGVYITKMDGKVTLKIIGIVGSRSRDQQFDYIQVHKIFFNLYKLGDWICSGGCPTGGDRFALILHKNYDIPYLEFPARWRVDGNYNSRTGFERNTDIAENSDILIACVAKNRLGGTEDTIKIHGADNLYIVEKNDGW